MRRPAVLRAVVCDEPRAPGRWPKERLGGGGARHSRQPQHVPACRLLLVAALPNEAHELIESGPLAHLVTLNPDGSPQVTCIWVGLDGDELVSGHLGDRRKLQNVRRDPRVALSLEGTRIDPPGLKEYLVIHGRARLEEGGAPELLQRLAHYLEARRHVPADGRPAGRLHDAHHHRAHRRRRPLGAPLAPGGGRSRPRPHIAAELALSAVRAIEDEVISSGRGRKSD